MKLSLCQMIAIICILAVGFIAFSPFVQTADANLASITIWEEYQVDLCNNGHVHAIWLAQWYPIAWEEHYDGHDNHFDSYDLPSYYHYQRSVYENSITCNPYYVVSLPYPYANV